MYRKLLFVLIALAMVGLLVGLAGCPQPEPPPPPIDPEQDDEGPAQVEEEMPAMEEPTEGEDPAEGEPAEGEDPAAEATEGEDAPPPPPPPG